MIRRRLIRRRLCAILFVSALAAHVEATEQTSAGLGESDAQTSAGAEKSDEPSPFALGFLAFGDFYAVPSNHLPEADGDIGAWIRRVYLTFDYTWSPRLFTRLRFEANQDGDFVNHGFTVDFKDVYLQWSVGRQNILVGLVPSPTFDIQDRIWGYRHLEKTPLDLQGVPSRDNGIAANGPINQSGRLRYRAMFGSGANFGKETGEGEKFMGAVTWGGERGWLFDVYGDFQELPDATDRTSLQVFSVYRGGDGRLGLQYFYQDREDDPRLELASAYGVVDLSPTVTFVGRIDRLMTPSIKGNDIDYLPFDPNAKATLFIAGVEFRLHRYVSLMPNVEFIIYDEPDSVEKPKNDFFIRLTFYFHS